MSARFALRSSAARISPASLLRPRSYAFASSSMASTTNGEKPSLRYADIGINLSDQIFRGWQHGKKAHEDDLESVVQRARDAGVRKMMVTGSDLIESKNAVNLAEDHPGLCYATVGVHPCSAKTFDKHEGGPEKLLEELKKLAQESRDAGTATAFGEIGLDYDRLQHASKETQMKYFEKQLDLAAELHMPLFLHMRAAWDDFKALLQPRLEKFPKRGVIHSFTGTLEEMQNIVQLGFDIGINGCSLKTEDNLAVVKEVPMDRLQIETDGPWCEIRPSHAASVHLKDLPTEMQLPKAVKKEKWTKDTMVKGRNEPCAIGHVAWVVAKVKGVPVEEVAEAAWNNSIRMFSLGESSS
ncbi:Deoxyribonuclease Tat-D [Pseudocercospora fuligena]|uniref:Deoxyribonuclease Tat-D n=1 Tax=Pseudocercospora fuligena TaxID=685502 RepID=A0A8H6RS55_9PEZI|nr:Deoxyribonuclease Tat-D [Pseudocercospora fuligena]